MDSTMPTHRTEATLQQDGTLTLEHLPFRAGQAVEVIILPRSDTARSVELYSLRGTPYRYERPTDPAAEEDWEAIQ